LMIRFLQFQCMQQTIGRTLRLIGTMVAERSGLLMAILKLKSGCTK